MLNLSFLVGMLFTTIKEFKKFRRLNEIKNKHYFKFLNNDGDNVKMACVAMDVHGLYIHL